MKIHLIENIRKEIRDILPPDIRVSEIDFEGPLLVLYTKDVEKFITSPQLVADLAQNIKKRIVVRPHSSILQDEKIAEKHIKKGIPQEAEITNIYFDRECGEVIVEAKNPGTAIGKYGTTLNEIKKKIGWLIRVVRVPPLKCRITDDIRAYLRQVRNERKNILLKIGSKIYRDVSYSQEPWVRLTALGGYREVGRSATLLSTPISKVLIDCGLNITDNSGPYLHLPELGELAKDSLDAVIITHAHLDHCGLLPLLYKYDYKGPVYCTQPTRDLMVLLQLDYLKVTQYLEKKAIYDSKYISEMVKYCITLPYGETTDITPDIKLTLHPAAHILGSAIVHLHIGDGLYNVVFTGDMKYERTWLFSLPASKFPRLETLVIEATYGGQNDFQPTRTTAYENMKKSISKVIERKSKVIIPVFAVGRSQELMLVFEQLVREKAIPYTNVYLDGMIFDATALHTAYPEYLSPRLRELIFSKQDNPFLSPIFYNVENSQKRDEIINSSEPCVILATAGMLNGGPVLEYLSEFAENKNNMLIFAGYQVEGTLGRKIQKGERAVVINDKKVNLNLEIETIDGFSGHSDRRQLLTYLYHLVPKPEKVIIYHGDKEKCLDLAYTIKKRYNLDVRIPLNLETIRIR